MKKTSRLALRKETLIHLTHGRAVGGFLSDIAGICGVTQPTTGTPPITLVCTASACTASVGAVCASMASNCNTCPM